MKRIIAFLIGSALLYGAVWASVALVDMTVDPPEVVYCDGREGVAQRVSDGISIADPGGADTRFEFLWGDDTDEVSPDELLWVAYCLGVPIDAGDGAEVPLSALGPVDEIRFSASGQAFSWDGLRGIKCRQMPASARNEVDPATTHVNLAPALAMSMARTGTDGGDVNVGDMTYMITIGNPVPADFQLFGVSAPGGTVIRAGLPICEGTAPYHSNVVTVVASGGVFTPPCNGSCIISCHSDDDGHVSVGGVKATSTLGSGGTNQLFVVGGQPYPVEAGFNSIGGPYLFEPKIEFIPDEGGMPHLEVSPKVIRFSLKKGQGEADRRAHEVRIVGENIDARRYRIACDEPPGGVKIMDGRFVIDVGQTTYWKGMNGTNTIEVTYQLFDGAEQIDSATAAFEVDTEKEETCCGACSCGEGTVESNDSVDFAQKFGRTPWIPGLPSGALKIHETSSSGRLGTPAVLYFDHPMQRRLLTRQGLDVVIVDSSGDCTEYRNGYPFGVSAGRVGQVYADPEGQIIEVLPDRTRLFYGVDGRVRSIAPPDGAPVGIADLGISVETDADGYLSRVTSCSDGEMTVTRESDHSWTLTWSSPSGAFVKSFAFALEGDDVFSLYEYRNEDFNFRYRWTYVDAAKDWMLEKGAGTTSVTREEKFIEWDGVNSVWEIVRRFVDPGDGSFIEERSVLDTERGVGRTLSRSANGQDLYSAGRDGATGLITNECRIGSAPRSYRYDQYGRTLSESTVTGGGLAKETFYGYAEPDNAGTLDRRPTNRVERLAGVVVSETSYVYSTNSVETARSFGGAVRRSRTEFDALGRRTLSVSEDGRASRVAYSEIEDDCSWSETTDEGVWCDLNGFELVDGKSTRMCEEFDAFGNMLRQTRYAFVGGDWHETGWTTNRYNATHKVVYSERSDGRTSASEWICTGSIWERDEDGIVVSNRYDGAKRKVSSTRYSPWGETTTAYSYDAAGRIVREITTAGGCETNSVSRVYDERGRVVSSTDSQGRTTTTAYSDDDLVTTVTYADGGTRVTTLNADGSLHSVTGTAVTPEYHTYGVTADGLEWECVRYGRADSPRFEKTYRNGFGEIVRTERSGFGGATLVTDSVYDAKGRLVSTAETGKPSVTYSYDDWGDLVSTVETADGVSRTTESASGNVILDGEVWNGRSRTVRTSDGAIVPLVTESYSKLSGLSLDGIENGFTVDVRGNTNRVTSALDPSIAARTTTEERAGLSNRAVSMTLDGFENSSVGFNGASTIAFADAYRRGLTHRDGRGNVSRTYYDNFGRVSSQVDADGNATSFGYDAMGRLAATTNALGLVTTYEYDLRGNRTYEGGATYPVRYAYDVYGNRTSMTTYRDEDGAAGDTTSWVYDEASGLVTEKRYADGTSVCYNYSDDGKLTSRTWARGVVTTYAYDGWGNLVSTTYSDGTPSVTLSYDALGRLVTANDVAGTTTYSYDEYGDEAQVATSGLYSKTLTRHRDAYGRDLGHTMDGSRKNIIEYEPTTGRIKRTMLGGAWFTWDYLAGSDLKSRLTYGGSGNTEWTYEPKRDLLTRVKNTIYGAVVSQYDYTNDEIGRRTEIARSGTKMTETRSDAYGYNARSELTNAVKNATLNEYAYRYDDIGNRETSFERGMSATYAANCLNQYTDIEYSAVQPSTSNLQPLYDADGNQTLVKTKTGIWSVTYNGENRPVLWTCGATNIVMKFDRMGRRVEYIESVGSVTNKHQKFVYDGYLCIQRLNGSNNSITELFEWDPTEKVATRPMFMQYRVPGQTYALFYTHDGNKNVSEVVHYSRANGVAAHYEYAPFGEITAQVRQGGITAYDFSALNPWRFSSEYADDMLVLVCYNYRHYNPIDGRWISKDRVVHNLNSYALLFNAVFATQDCLGLVDQTTIDLILLAMEMVTGHQERLFYEMLLPTILDLLDDSTLGFVHSALNWLFFGKAFELSFDSYDPGWRPDEFDSDKYANSIKKVCATGDDSSFDAKRVVDTYKKGLYTISNLGAPGQYTVSLEGKFSRTKMNNKCRWYFNGEVKIPEDIFDFNICGGERSWLGQFITECVAYVQSRFDVGHDFHITFKGSRQVKDEGGCCE